MRERLSKYSLTLHPDKTRLLAFGRFAADQRARVGLGKPETFDFLGFTFISGKSREGKFLVRRKSRRDRVKAKLKEIKVALRANMHKPIPEQGSWLGQVVRGYFAYHAVPTNIEAISGHPMLKDAAIENVKTWKFRNSYAEGKYKATFDYRLLSSGPQKVTFESFHRVEVATCLPVQWQP